MKKVLLFLRRLLLAFVFVPLVCCHGHHLAHGAEPFRIVASTFPVWLFTANVCVDAAGVKLELLVPAQAGCPHDFAPSPAQLQKLAGADALVLNGLDLEDFIEKPRKSIAPAAQIVLASPGVPTLPDPHDPSRPNPHIFAAPAQAAIMVRNIAKGLSTLNPENAGIYQANAERYAAGLEKISASLREVGKKAANRKVALQHDALAYLAANADLEVIAIMEHGSSAAARGRLEKEIRGSQPALLIGDVQYTDRLLKSISDATGIPELSLSACASGPQDAPLDYYEAVMEKNLQLLRQHLDQH